MIPMLGGVTDKQFNEYFMNMIIFDPTPHTYTRLSPITFCDFLARTNVITLQQRSLYEQANQFWRKQLDGGAFKPIIDNNGISICEEQQCDWNPLIDHLQRLVRVMELNNAYQRMHYLSHVCYLMSEAKGDDNMDYYRVLFANIINPVLYPNSLNTTKDFLPILNYIDPRFDESVTFACAVADKFIQSHLGRPSDTYDIERLQALKTNVTQALQCIQKNKDSQDKSTWLNELSRCLLSSALLNADLHACELYQVMERDGLRCCKPLRELKRILKMHEKGSYSDDPDDAIDSLLDVYSSINSGLKAYNIPSDKGGTS